MKEIAKGVYSEDRFSVETGKPGGYHGCNPNYVATSDGIVVIDSPRLPTDAVRMRNEMMQKGRVRYIINTDSHLDHTGGNFFMPGGIVVSHQGVRETLLAIENGASSPNEKEPEAKKGGIANRIIPNVRIDDPGGIPLMEGYRPRIPTVTFTDRLNLFVGEYTFELSYLPGHSDSHIGVYIPEVKVFFAGDNFTNLTQPNLAHCLPREWVQSLKKIEQKDVAIVVSGHGRLCYDAKEVRNFRLFIEQCIAMVKEAIKKGVTKEEAGATISFEDLYPGPGRGGAVHPGPATQRANVLRFYEMLSR